MCAGIYYIISEKVHILFFFDNYHIQMLIHFACVLYYESIKNKHKTIKCTVKRFETALPHQVQCTMSLLYFFGVTDVI